MPIPTRSEAQQRADDIRIFDLELDRLQDEGVLTLNSVQREAVSQHHAQLLEQYAKSFDIDRGTEAKKLSLGMRIASFLGALALAASVFFLFHQFWGHFDTWAQVAILLVSAFGTLIATMWVHGRESTGYFTKLAALVAFACFVLNIAMLGQIFDIRPSDKALLPWAAYAFLLAYACDLRLLLAAGILCMIAFISARTGTWSGMYWLYFGQRPENFFSAGLVMLAVPSVFDHRHYSGFAPIYRVFGMLSWFLPVLVLSNWGTGSYLELDRGLIEGMYQVVGFVGCAAAVWIGIRRHWGDLVNTGMTLFVILLYTKFFDWWWQAMPKYLFFFVLGVTAILFLLVLRRLRGALAMAQGARA